MPRKSKSVTVESGNTLFNLSDYEVKKSQEFYDPAWSKMFDDQVESNNQIEDEKIEDDQFEDDEITEEEPELFEIETIGHGFTEELEKLTPDNVRAFLFIVSKCDTCINLGIVVKTNPNGFFVDWLNFGISKQRVNFYCGINCFSNWKRDSRLDRLSIAPKSLIDNFLESRDFSFSNKVSIPDNWEDQGGLWDVSPQYWNHGDEACFYDGHNIFIGNKCKLITNKIKNEYLSPRWYLSYLEKFEDKNGHSGIIQNDHMKDETQFEILPIIGAIEKIKND